MKIEEALALVDNLKPNQYDDQVKIKWLSDLDGKVFKEVIKTHELPFVEVEKISEITGESYTVLEQIEPVYAGYTEYDMGKELLVNEPYSDIYTYYIFAMIDFHNQEMDRYTNSMLMFNAKYDEFAAYYNRTYRPMSYTPKY